MTDTYGVSIKDKDTTLITGTPDLTLDQAQITAARAERDGHAATIVNADGTEVPVERNG